MTFLEVKDECPIKVIWRGKWQPTPVFMPGEYPWTDEHGRVHPLGLQESDKA